MSYSRVTSPTESGRTSDLYVLYDGTRYLCWCTASAFETEDPTEMLSHVAVHGAHGLAYPAKLPLRLLDDAKRRRTE